MPRYEYKIEGQYGTHTDDTAGTQEQPGEIKVNFIDKTKITATSGYIMHPAFKFGDIELNGIWVGEFETSSTDCLPTILPDKLSSSKFELSQVFTKSQLVATYLTDSNADSHISRNEDWRAVAYLSQSKYGNFSYVGSEKEIFINNSSDHYTGRSGGNIGGNTPINGTYADQASTTGNITGIYDMSGGAAEWVMGIIILVMLLVYTFSHVDHQQ